MKPSSPSCMPSFSKAWADGTSEVSSDEGEVPVLSIIVRSAE